MDEVVSASTAGVSSANIAGFAGAGFVMAAAVVMAMTSPPTRREFLVALISTLAFSIGGGGTVIMYLNLQHWSNDVFGLMAILGIAFTCGLPGWILVRSCFVFADKNKRASIIEIIKQIKDVWK